MADAAIEKLQQMVDASRRIVFFGGAGVSTESGIPDFRSPDGLYSQKYKVPPEQMLSHSFYRTHREEFFEFYRDKLLFFGARPNPAHQKLAELERAGKRVTVITQNIDGLHSEAGSRNVIELHGSVRRNTCQRCGKTYDAHFVKDSPGPPQCSCGGEVKPNVVLYEEALNAEDLAAAARAIAAAELLIVAGTSLVVYPAAGLVEYYHGRRLVVINRQPTALDERADLLITDPVGRVMAQLECGQD